ncbi:hypothetical protein BJ138DRAFT_1062114 [Hygrophoropsis aurantiaca]|uniref:Uncharacterized protein n=1 Tax=Hygrophoropsis aurantiaca TaxID=72124 RepID=A0ACB8AF86_9AGAM|nr:hypothetical protein BJ138DRAFT_1062114 [Hygrophoropsis aurantiaca]
MPKVTSSSIGNTGRPALRRNQACRSCRKRKLKCDAARPHCATCVKQWQALISVPAPVGYAHPTEPQCVYDPVDGLNLAPDIDPLEKIRLLEEEVSKLKTRLQEQNVIISSPHLTQPLRHHPQALLRPTSASSSGSGSQSSGSLSNQLSQHAGKSPLNPSRPSESHCPKHDEHAELTDIGNRCSTDAILSLIYSGWNPDLPEPHILEHYVDVFFKCDPCGPRILHRPSFLASLRLHPRDPSFPHSAILHAICASASRWSSRNVAVMPDGSRRDEFAEYHASKTRQYIDKTMATGDDIFHVVQACILLAWYFYQEGRWVEIWIFAGFQTRVAVPLRLNYPGTFSTHGNNSPSGYLPPPKDIRDLESRRRTWWMTIMFDRIVSVGGWIHAIDERDLGTELPLCAADFEAEQLMPSNPQDMATEELFTTHLPRYTDPFLLLIKAVMLFGRVTDFNVRSSLRAPTAPSKNQDPFMLPGFHELDALVCDDFISNLPHTYRLNHGVTDGPSGKNPVDTDLYMVHLIPHAAAITLHNPYLDLNEMERPSTIRCLNAARSILTAYFMLSATSLDVTRLHPFVTICWYLAAVVQVQVCKHFIEAGDEVREAQVWGEINVLRQAMLDYGTRSPIGTRQEKLLQGLMREIVRLTSQKQPLEVGLPLYPFSHSTLFSESSSRMTQDGIPMAPLPNPNSEIHQSIDDSQLRETLPFGMEISTSHPSGCLAWTPSDPRGSGEVDTWTFST